MDVTYGVDRGLECVYSRGITLIVSILTLFDNVRMIHRFYNLSVNKDGQIIFTVKMKLSAEDICGTKTICYVNLLLRSLLPGSLNLS